LPADDVIHDTAVGCSQLKSPNGHTHLVLIRTQDSSAPRHFGISPWTLWP